MPEKGSVEPLWPSVTLPHVIGGIEEQGAAQRLPPKPQTGLPLPRVVARELTLQSPPNWLKSELLVPWGFALSSDSTKFHSVLMITVTTAILYVAGSALGVFTHINPVNPPGSFMGSTVLLHLFYR